MKLDLIVYSKLNRVTHQRNVAYTFLVITGFVLAFVVVHEFSNRKKSY